MNSILIFFLLLLFFSLEYISSACNFDNRFVDFTKNKFLNFLDFFKKICNPPRTENLSKNDKISFSHQKTFLLEQIFSPLALKK